MINLCFRELTAQLTIEFSSTFDFNKPFITYDIAIGLLTIHKDNSMDNIGCGGAFDVGIAFKSSLF